MAKQSTTTRTSTKSIRFKYVKSTKNCHRYEECDAGGNFIDQKAGVHSIGTIYVQKRLVGDQPTDFIDVTVTTSGDVRAAA